MIRTLLLLLSLMLLAATGLLLFQGNTPEPASHFEEANRETADPEEDMDRSGQDDDPERQELEPMSNEPGFLTGRCLADGQPLAGALITVSALSTSETAFEVATGQDGRFRIGPLPQASYQLSVKTPDHLPLTQQVRHRWVR